MGRQITKETIRIDSIILADYPPHSKEVNNMKIKLCFFCCLFLLLQNQDTFSQLSSTLVNYRDTAFWQDYHESFRIGESKAANEIRSIAVDGASNIWVATPEGIFMKKHEISGWTCMITGEDQGPAYSVITDDTNSIWLGTWNGVYVFRNNLLSKVRGTDGPVSALCAQKNDIYAFGPKGVWMFAGNEFVKKDYKIARSIRKAISDGKDGIWVSSDVGLYHIQNNNVQHYFDTSILVSAYVKALALDDHQQLWVGGLGGVSILRESIKIKTLKPSEGIPSVYVHCVERSSSGEMWVGTDVGIVRYAPNGSHTLRFGRRWLLDDKVSDIAFDKEGNAWVATAKGVSAIKRKKMTLEQKQDFFYDITMKRHIREPWISGPAKLKDPSDLNSWQPEDDDNDGEFTGSYLAMESFRYAVTKSKDAKQKAGKAFDFLKLLQTITGTDGFFARTIVPVSWGDNVHDPNVMYTERQLAEELVKEPRFKAVEKRWHKSKDGKWLWKGDTSSDEWCGHLFGYFFYYELVADKTEKKIVAAHVARLVDHLIKHNFNMVDVDGTHTRWSVWSPDQLNRDPEWLPDRYQNSMELLAFLKLAHYMTGENKYQEHYLRLIKEEHYLENMAKVPDQNPAFFIYFDVILQSYIYPILIGCEKDPQLLSFYEKHFDEWMEIRKVDKSPLINFLYCYTRNKKVELEASVDFLTDTPLDLVNWKFDHTKREDIKLVREPVLDDMQIDQLPPPAIRTAIRWDKNPWAAVNGFPTIEREPVFWLLPYWMGRYLKMIE